MRKTLQTVTLVVALAAMVQAMVDVWGLIIMIQWFSEKNITISSQSASTVQTYTDHFTITAFTFSLSIFFFLLWKSQKRQ